MMRTTAMRMQQQARMKAHLRFFHTIFFLMAWVCTRYEDDESSSCSVRMVSSSMSALRLSTSLRHPTFTVQRGAAKVERESSQH